MRTVLVVDDEPQIVRALRIALAARGYRVLAAGNGETALEVAAGERPDLVLLDLGLPGVDGVEVLRRLRSFSDVPVIVLSVREGQADKVAALDAGADDYLTKPFGVEELLARIRAALRRAVPAEAAPPVVRCGDIEVDRARRLVKKGGRPVRLTPTEYAILEALVSNPGKLLTHRFLVERAAGGGSANSSQYARAYVAQLRRKLEDDPARPRWILTEPGVGYRWAEAAPG
jgi:two-component system KDP operon response regulator KdpE